MNPLKVALATYPYAGNGGQAAEHPDVRDFIRRVERFCLADPRIGCEGVLPVIDDADTPITMLRNATVLAARRHNIDVLVMVDSDMAPDFELYQGTPNQVPFFPAAFDFIYKAWERGRYVSVGAPYCGEGDTQNVYVFNWRNKSNRPDENTMKLDMLTREEAVRYDGFVNCDAIGTGLIAFAMPCFDLIEPLTFTPERVQALVENYMAGNISLYEFVGGMQEQSFFEYGYKDRYHAQKDTTEDVFATRDMALAGKRAWNYNPLYCLWNAWAGHHKDTCVGRPKLMTGDGVGPKYFDPALRRPPASQQQTQLHAWLQQEPANEPPPPNFQPSPPAAAVHQAAAPPVRPAPAQPPAYDAGHPQAAPSARDVMARLAPEARPAAVMPDGSVSQIDAPESVPEPLPKDLYRTLVNNGVDSNVARQLSESVAAARATNNQAELQRLGEAIETAINGAQPQGPATPATPPTGQPANPAATPQPVQPQPGAVYQQHAGVTNWNGNGQGGATTAPQQATNVEPPTVMLTEQMVAHLAGLAQYAETAVGMPGRAIVLGDNSDQIAVAIAKATQNMQVLCGGAGVGETPWLSVVGALLGQRINLFKDNDAGTGQQRIISDPVEFSEFYAQSNLGPVQLVVINRPGRTEVSKLVAQWLDHVVPNGVISGTSCEGETASELQAIFGPNLQAEPPVWWVVNAQTPTQQQPTPVQQPAVT